MVEFRQHKNNLCPESKAEGTALCVSKQSGRAQDFFFFTTLGCRDARSGYEMASLARGPGQKGEGQLQANVLHHDHFIVPCFVVRMRT